MEPSITVVVPTRERAVYLRHSLQTCVRERYDDLEILVLDNASDDETPEVVAAMRDSRIRYVRSDARLSMRNNFERGVESARGDILCFIGDDDALFPGALDRVAALFANAEIDAVSATRAHYFWPDYAAARKNSALIPRSSCVRTLRSRPPLRRLLDHNDFYTLPCLYHGFVRRSAVESVRRAQGRFFMSSIVDAYSSIALSALDMSYAFSEAPLVVNGASKRSNGVAHFKKGDATEEKIRWNAEEDLGFLPGFANSLTLGALILESAVRYCRANDIPTIEPLLDPAGVQNAIVQERQSRVAAGHEHVDETIGALCRTLEVKVPAPRPPAKQSSRALTLARAFAKARPVSFELPEVHDIASASTTLASLADRGHLGLLSDLPSQVRAALRFAG